MLTLGQGFRKSEDRKRLAGVRIHLEDHAVQQDPVLGHFKPVRCVQQELLDDGIHLAPQNAVVRPGKPGVRKEGGAAGKNLVVRGLDMGVGSDDSGDLAVEHPTEGDFLGSRLGMEIDNNDWGLGAKPFHGLQGEWEGVVERRHEGASLKIEDGDRGEAVLLADGEAVPRNVGGIIQGAEESGLQGEITDDFLLIPDMIPGRDDIDAGVEEFAGNCGGNAISAGGIFSISDNEIESVAMDEFGEERFNGSAAGFADDIAYEEKFHGCAGEET